MWMVKQWEWPQRKRRAPSLHYNSCVCLFSPLLRSGTTQMLLMWPLPAARQKREWGSLRDKFPDRFLIYINNECFSWYCMLSKEVLSEIILDWGTFGCFSYKQIACLFSVTHTWALPNEQPIWRDFYIRLSQNDAHFKCYSNINISAQNCLLCSYMSPWYAYFFLTVSHSAFRQKWMILWCSVGIGNITDCRVNKYIFYEGASPSALWRHAKLASSGCPAHLKFRSKWGEKKFLKYIVCIFLHKMIKMQFQPTTAVEYFFALLHLTTNAHFYLIPPNIQFCHPELESQLTYFHGYMIVCKQTIPRIEDPHSVSQGSDFHSDLCQGKK